MLGFSPERLPDVSRRFCEKHDAAPEMGAPPVSRRPLEKLRKSLWIRYRHLAREAFAHICSRATLDGSAILEEGRGGGALRAGGEDEVGAMLAADDAGQGGEVVADQGDLLGGGEVEVDRAEKVGEGLGMLDGGVGEEAEDAFGLLLVGPFACQG